MNWKGEIGGKKEREGEIERRRATLQCQIHSDKNASQTNLIGLRIRKHTVEDGRKKRREKPDIAPHGCVILTGHQPD